MNIFFFFFPFFFTSTSSLLLAAPDVTCTEIIVPIRSLFKGKTTYTIGFACDVV